LTPPESKVFSAAWLKPFSVLQALIFCALLPSRGGFRIPPPSSQVLLMLSPGFSPRE
jgi:hypothetical protein